MKLYAGTTEQFLTDAKLHRIAEKLRIEYIAQIGHKPGGSEVASWQNSLAALALLIDQADLKDHGLEYQLGNTSKRLDALLTGHNASSAENAVIVELKQWGATAASNANGCVETFVLRPVPHPSVQVEQYEQWLLDNHTVFYEDGVGLAGVSWLHNMQFDPADELFAPKHAEYMAPIRRPLHGPHQANLSRPPHPRPRMVLRVFRRLHGTGASGRHFTPPHEFWI